MAEAFKIEKTTAPHLIIEQLENNIYEFSASAIGKHDGVLFAFTVHNENNALVAGIAGWTWANACEITHLWVDSTVRGKGLGQRLLKEAEREAQHQQSKIILIRSYSFQAPHFYEKYGYKTECIIPDFPVGHHYHILTKRMA